MIIKTHEEFAEATRQFADYVIEQVFGNGDVDGGDAQDQALELGLIRPTTYDPDVHDGMPVDLPDVEEGVYFRHPWLESGILPYQTSTHRMFVSSFTGGGWCWGVKTPSCPDELEVVCEGPDGVVVERARYRKV